MSKLLRSACVSATSVGNLLMGTQTSVVQHLEPGWYSSADQSATFRARQRSSFSCSVVAVMSFAPLLRLTISPMRRGKRSQRVVTGQGKEQRENIPRTGALHVELDLLIRPGKLEEQAWLLAPLAGVLVFSLCAVDGRHHSVVENLDTLHGNTVLHDLGDRVCGGLDARERRHGHGIRQQRGQPQRRLDHEAQRAFASHE